MTSGTRIQLCGRLRVDLDGRHVTPQLRGRQGRVLLAYLVLKRRRTVSRDEMVTAIWPEDKPADPPAALRTQLSRLRSALGGAALAGRDTVELNLPSDAWIDIEAADEAKFATERALAGSEWNEAWSQAHVVLNIAGRPFLAGFQAPWVDETRSDLEEMELRALDAIARAGLRLGGSELAVAERSAREMVRRAPFRESGYLSLMRTLSADGNASEALHIYDQLRTLLASQLGTAPGPQLQDLHNRLLRGQADLD